MTGTHRFLLVFGGLALLSGFPSYAGPEPAARAPGPAALVDAYPEHLARVEGNSLVWNDGTRSVFDDGRIRQDLEQKLNDPSLKLQLEQIYPAGAGVDDAPARDHDPGRVRFEPFFRKMYGSTAAEVERRLRTITWMPNTHPQRIRVTTVNGVDKKLERISARMEALPASFRKFGARLGGTFHWRVIAGTNRLSAHSFGIAIDLNPDLGDYWRWQTREKAVVAPYRNRVPEEVVRLFEEEGFIWGGRWYHFDTMHFEYRPELLPPREVAPQEGRPRRQDPRSE